MAYISDITRVIFAIIVIFLVGSILVAGFAGFGILFLYYGYPAYDVQELQYTTTGTIDGQEVNQTQIIQTLIPDVEYLNFQLLIQLVFVLSILILATSVFFAGVMVFLRPSSHPPKEEKSRLAKLTE